MVMRVWVRVRMKVKVRGRYLQRRFRCESTQLTPTLYGQYRLIWRVRVRVGVRC